MTGPAALRTPAGGLLSGEAATIEPPDERLDHYEPMPLSILARDSRVNVELTIPAEGFAWAVFK